MTLEKKAEDGCRLNFVSHWTIVLRYLEQTQTFEIFGRIIVHNESDGVENTNPS